VIAGSDTTIENVELSGAKVPDQNGAAIRQEGANLTLRDCYIHDNEDGILTGAGATSEILIERCEFASNGFGDGFSHNMYIGKVKKFTPAGELFPSRPHRPQREVAGDREPHPLQPHQRRGRRQPPATPSTSPTAAAPS
jgi:hypothetical protein